MKKLRYYYITCEGFLTSSENYVPDEICSDCGSSTTGLGWYDHDIVDEILHKHMGKEYTTFEEFIYHVVEELDYRQEYVDNECFC